MNVGHIEGGAKVGWELFVWKIIQSLIKNKRISSVAHIHNYKPTFAPTLYGRNWMLKILILDTE